MSIMVLIADADPGFRRLLRSQLEPAVDVVGEACSGEEAVRLAKERKPEIVLMDIAIPGLDGIQATHRITAANPRSKVVLMTLHDEEAYLSATGKSGAAMFLPKRLVRRQVAAAVRALAAGQLAPGRMEGERRERERRQFLARPGELLSWDGTERRHSSDRAA